MNTLKTCLAMLLFTAILIACNQKHSEPSRESISDLALKRGQVISCGPPEKEFGTVDFEMSCSKNVQQDFNVAVEMLHSFEYDEAEKMFAKVIDAAPGCAMAYWGVAMCCYHPLWEPPSDADLAKGSKAVAIAKTITEQSKKEAGFIDAIAAYYEDWKKNNARARSLHFEEAMEQLHTQYPGDKEAAIFYALSLDAAADATDKTYANQKKAGAILEQLYKQLPNHPGIVHYIIHTYDYPSIANLGLAAAKQYASVAPSSAHALHMPSHIFTRLGMWDDCIQSNRRSAASAQCYAQSANIKGHWDEELHALDYLVYAYLQKGDNTAANEQLQYIENIHEVSPVNFKVTYTFAASPARVALENKNWKAAAGLQLHPNVNWQKFPWQEAIIHFARLLGTAHSNNIVAATIELGKMQTLYDTLQKQKDLYRSKQVAIQITSGEAWIAFMQGKKAEALNSMKLAADMEDSTSKPPVTPGEVLPARELYADMLLQMQQNDKALEEYKEALQKAPNRFNSLYGAAVAAERFGNMAEAKAYYQQLASIAAPNSNRPEIAAAKTFLTKHNN